MSNFACWLQLYGKSQIELGLHTDHSIVNLLTRVQNYLYAFPRYYCRLVIRKHGPFFDVVSEKLFPDLPDSASAMAKVFLNIEQFEIGQSYVTAKIINKYGDKVGLNIQGGKPGIELQESLFRLQGKQIPRHVYIITKVKDSGNLLVRKLPVVGIKDWLLIYEDTLFLLAVKDRYDEIEFRVV
jgi:hypothetical protein